MVVMGTSPMNCPAVANILLGSRIAACYTTPRHRVWALLPMCSVFHRNARFPLGPSEVAFALNLCGSILNTTGPALRDLAGR